MGPLSLLVLLQCVAQCLSLYTTFSTWESRCLVEDVPDNTLITVDYQVRFWDVRNERYPEGATEDAVLQVTVHKNNELKLSKEQKGLGKVVFFAEEYGEYKICLELYPRKDKQYETVTSRLYLAVDRQYHEDENELVEQAKDNIISGLQVAMRKMKMIKSEQEYYKKREKKFRVTSRITAGRVLWYALLTALTVVCCSLYMVHNLKNFFIAKKLV